MAGAGAGAGAGAKKNHSDSLKELAEKKSHTVSEVKNKGRTAANKEARIHTDAFRRLLVLVEFAYLS